MGFHIQLRVNLVKSRKQISKHQNQGYWKSLTTHLFFILIDYTGLIIGLIKKTQQHEYAYKHGSQLSQTTLRVHNFKLN
jgi:hypothetical protein